MLDPLSMLLHALAPYRWLAALACALAIARALLTTPKVKGWIGEALLHAVLRIGLPRRRYRLLRNVTLPTADGSTQVDHIVVSRHGVFVVETKNYRGWIFGTAHDKTWTQTFRRSSHTFQNPLRQNVKHVRTLAEIAGIDKRALVSLVVFVGPAVIKTPMPANVVSGALACLAAIRRRAEPLLDEDEVERILDAIRAGRLPPSRATDAAHARHVQELVEARRRLQRAVAALPAPGVPPVTPTATAGASCPRCGGATDAYTYRSGPKAGQSFRGCTRFPACAWRAEQPAAAAAAALS